jgi:hypothetical protein
MIHPPHQQLYQAKKNYFYYKNYLLAVDKIRNLALIIENIIVFYFLAN